MDGRSLPRKHEGGLERGHRRYFAVPLCVLSALPRQGQQSEHRKDHVHLIVAFPNTTTYKHALNVMDLLSAEGKKAINKCEAVVGIRNVYDYLIHDTEDCRKKGKEQYDPSERITGNNFDIGAYEQLGTAEKNEMFLEMGQAIRKAWLHQLHGLL